MNRTPTLPPESEAAFQKAVIQLARLSGWRVAHFRPGLTRRGKWVTPVAADGAGFPDLVLVRAQAAWTDHGRIIFLELKTERGKLSATQEEWAAVLRQCAGVEYHVLRPSDWEFLTTLLA